MLVQKHLNAKIVSDFIEQSFVTDSLLLVSVNDLVSFLSIGTTF